MKQVIDAISHVLRTDPVIAGIVGVDQHGTVRVYENTAKPDEEPPFLVWNLIDAPEPSGTYGDLHSMEIPQVQVSCWGRNPGEAWQLWDLVLEVFEVAEMDVELEPYSLMRMKRIGGSPLIRDEDTSWVQVPATYEVAISR